MDVPTLRTNRTLMRPWRESDLDAIAAWMADPEVMRFLGGVAGRPRARWALARYLDHWHTRGYGLWLVESLTDGSVLGRVGLWNPEGWPGPEVGWTLVRSAWGQGLASECAIAARDWGFAHLPEVDRLYSLIDPANRASQRVAERIGSARVGTWHIAEVDQTVDLWAVGRPAG